MTLTRWKESSSASGITCGGLYKQATGAEKDSLDAALETVWQVKREYRVELKARRKASADAFVARLQKQSVPRAA
jgi:hypothetical protein